MSFLGTPGLFRRSSSRSDHQRRSASASSGNSHDQAPRRPASIVTHTAPGAFRASTLDCRLADNMDIDQVVDQTVDLHLLDYVSECDSNLVCPICRCPLVDPVSLSECEHCFCRDCLRQTWQQQPYMPGIPKGRCPTCRTACLLPTRASISRILINILDDLVVKCPKHEEGCGAQVKRGEVEEHVRRYCDYTQVECPSEACDLTQRRKDGKECLHYGVSCIECKETITLAELQSHWTVRCPDRTVTCELCEDAVFARDIATHAKDVCLAAIISCTGSPYGCDYQSKRATITDHTRTCTFAALGPFLETQATRTKSLEDRQALMARRLQILEGGFRSMETIIQPPTTDAPSAAIPDISISPSPAPDLLDDNPWPAAGVEGFTSPYTHLLSMHEALRDELARVSAALSDLDARHSMLILNENLRLKDELAYMAGQVGGLGRQVGWLTSARLHEQGVGPRVGAMAENVAAPRGRVKL